MNWGIFNYKGERFSHVSLSLVWYGGLLFGHDLNVLNDTLYVAVSYFSNCVNIFNLA